MANNYRFLGTIGFSECEGSVSWIQSSYGSSLQDVWSKLLILGQDHKARVCGQYFISIESIEKMATGNFVNDVDEWQWSVSDFPQIIPIK